ncbi:hypothetical protein B2G71_12575 [Novosphingobium sp. PC22D]|uniref:thermostable hemolysin n=1 Tax=Novosphingobium sp. PC22D TaxID=1962403 RepID=UPI000BF01F9C|nr:thermostable hemolysin [Novosphingobium sp. PC22D]PEQ12327.1 hypothetical protein B2G71_12575 [Novosphingobium sp. PC22D]
MDLDRKLVRDRYAGIFGAAVEPHFREFLSRSGSEGPTAVLGYARAGAEPLFLERYLDEPVERLVGAAFGRPIARDQIVELGNLAACNGWALVRLWGEAANDLGGAMEFAVATLTAPLRDMFRRMGIPVMPLARATADRAGSAGWGDYYQTDPLVCAGRIAEGQAAILRFLAGRRARAAA